MKLDGAGNSIYGATSAATKHVVTTSKGAGIEKDAKATSSSETIAACFRLQTHR